MHLTTAARFNPFGKNNIYQHILRPRQRGAHQSHAANRKLFQRSFTKNLAAARFFLTFPSKYSIL